MHFQPLSANHKNPSLLPPLPFMRHFEWKLGTIFVHDWIISHFLLCDSMGIIFAPGQNWAAVSMALPYPIWAMFLLPSIHPRTKLFDPLWCVNEPWLDFPLHFLWNHPFASLTFFPSSTCCCVKSLNWTNRYYHQMGNLFCALKWSFKNGNILKSNFSLIQHMLKIFIEKIESFSKFFRKTVKFRHYHCRKK